MIAYLLQRLHRRTFRLALGLADVAEELAAQGMRRRAWCVGMVCAGVARLGVVVIRLGQAVRP